MRNRPRIAPGSVPLYTYLRSSFNGEVAEVDTTMIAAFVAVMAIYVIATAASLDGFEC